MSESYNYKHFPMNVDSPLFKAFPNILHVGMDAPDGKVIVLEGDRETRLSEFWAEKPLLIEFGSLT